MPIKTPGEYISIYRDDRDHFKHVLDCLFIPAIEKSNLNPIKPIASGAELIQARIIKNIETAELVLCDISTLNPNVFFELGIRTALNKPVCLVKDDINKRIPFDTTIINHYTYESSLNTWEIEEEINLLSNHIKKSMKTNKDSNELWKYFSLSSIVHTSKARSSVEEKLDYLTLQIESIKKTTDSNRNKFIKWKIDWYNFFNKIGARLDRFNIKIKDFIIEDNSMWVWLEKKLFNNEIED